MRFVPRVQVQGGDGQRKRGGKLGVTFEVGCGLGSKVASTSSTRRAVGAPGELVREILVAKLDLYVELCTCWPR